MMSSIAERPLLARARRAVMLALGAFTLIGGVAGANPRHLAGARSPAIFADTGTLAAGSPPAGSGATVARRRNRPNRAFAGYVATQSGAATIRARLTVPAFRCTQRERAISPGVFLLSGPVDHEYFNAANIILGCYRGKPVTEEALVVNNVEHNRLRRLYAGDVIVVRVSDDPTGAMTVEVRDLTEGHRFEFRRRGQGVAAQAELAGDWASIDNDTQLPVPPPRFAPTTFTSVRVNARPLGALKPGGYDMAGANHKVEISAHRLFGTGRASFTCTRRG